MSGWSPFMGDTDLENIAKATIHILRNHIFKLFGPPSPLCKHVLCTENKQKLPFSDTTVLPPFHPKRAYVIYVWSLRQENEDLKLGKFHADANKMLALETENKKQSLIIQQLQVCIIFFRN